jgi:hypothetical protein
LNKLAEEQLKPPRHEDTKETNGRLSALVPLWLNKLAEEQLKPPRHEDTKETNGRLSALVPLWLILGWYGKTL